MSKLIKKLNFLILFISLFTIPTFSENTDNLENLIITATKTSTTEDNILVPITILTEEDINLSGASNLAELLSFVGGIDISMNGGPGQLTSLFVQGSNSNHVLILVDGVAINDSATGIAAIQNINPELINRIEIVKAPRTSLYGSQAIGGVINIFTKKNLRNSLQTGVNTGSDNTKSFNISTAMNRENIQSGLHLSHYQTDGFPSKVGSNLDSGYENKSVQAYLQSKDEKRTIKTSVWSTSGSTEYLDFFLNPISQDFDNLASTINIIKPINDQWLSSFNVNLSKDEIDQNNSDDFNHSKKTMLEWQNSLQLSPINEMIIGYIYEKEDFNASNYGLIVDSKLSTNAVYLEDLITLDKHQFLMAIRLNNKEQIKDQSTWNLEYGYKLNSEIKVVANLGKAIRNPSNFDLYGFGGNRELIPEVSDNKSIGIKYMPEGPSSIELRFFENKINELIAFNYSDYKLYNIEKASIKGIDLNFSTLIKKWEFKLNATLQNAVNENNRSRLLRRPKNSIRMGLRRNFGKVDININMAKNSSRLDFGNVMLHSYFIGNLVVRYRVNENLYLKAALNNFTDEEYTLANGYNTATRKAYIGLTYNPAL